MTKALNEQFTEERFEKLQEVKGDRTWKETILEEFGVTDE